MTFDQVRRIDSVIRRKKMQLEALKGSLLPSAIRYDIDKVQTSPDDAVSRTFARIDALEREIAKLEAKRPQLLAEVIDAIEEIEDDTAKELFTAFFVKRERMETITKRMGYSWQWGYWKIRKTLETLEKGM